MGTIAIFMLLLVVAYREEKSDMFDGDDWYHPGWPGEPYAGIFEPDKPERLRSK